MLDGGPWLQMCTVPGAARPLDGRPQGEVQVRPDRLGVVASFCCLGGRLSVASGCGLSAAVRVGAAWSSGSCCQFSLPAATLSGHVATCAALECRRGWCSMLVGLGRDLWHLWRGGRAVVGRTCNVKPQDIVATGSNELLARFGIDDLDLILKEGRLLLVWTCGTLQ